MIPTLKENDIVLASKLPYLFKPPKIGDIVITKSSLIKKIVEAKDGKYFLRGEDGHNFGWIAKKDILGKLIYKL